MCHQPCRTAENAHHSRALVVCRNEIDSTENVKVLTLKDPIRNQLTLDEVVGAAAAS